MKRVCFEDEYNSLGPLRTLVTLRPQVRQPGPAVWTHSGVEGVFSFASVYFIISLVPGDLDYD